MKNFVQFLRTQFHRNQNSKASQRILNLYEQLFLKLENHQNWFHVKCKQNKIFYTVHSYRNSKMFYQPDFKWNQFWKMNIKLTSSETPKMISRKIWTAEHVRTSVFVLSVESLIPLTFYVKSLLMIFPFRKNIQHFSKMATLHPDAQQHQFFACHWHIVIIGRCACSDDAGTATCGQLLVQCFHFVPWSFGILTSFEIMCCRCIEKWSITCF